MIDVGGSPTINLFFMIFYYFFIFYFNKIFCFLFIFIIILQSCPMIWSLLDAQYLEKSAKLRDIVDQLDMTIVSGAPN